jgi:hypothetical protein
MKAHLVLIISYHLVQDLAHSVLGGCRLSEYCGRRDDPVTNAELRRDGLTRA